MKVQNTIPLKWLLWSFWNHNHAFFGGSAGREGTAVQMGGALADQFTAIFKLDKSDRKTVIILGISAGFASVFGTP
jgi:H+/Cl- antiporter ClcA